MAEFLGYWVLPLGWSTKGSLEMLCTAPQTSHNLKASHHVINASEVALKALKNN